MYDLLKATSFIWFVIFLADLQTSQAQKCPTFWVGYHDSCYRFRWINKKGWNDAKQWCLAQSGDLVKLETTQERAWIINQTNIIDTHNRLHGEMNWWLGLNDIKSETTWVWGDGSPADPAVIQWNRGEPNNIGNEDCAGIARGKVYDRRCSTQSKYICERGRSVPLACDADQHWQTFSGDCYKVHTDLQTWYNAKKICNSQGSQLATIDDQMDEVVILDFAKNNNKPFWIGLQSIQTVVNGQISWTWGNNTYLTPSLTFWNKNQPQIANNRKNSSCGYVSNSAPNNYAWSADWCGLRKSYVCKKPEGVCPPGWISHMKRCYQFNIQFKYTWSQARAYCKAQGSLLMAIYGNTATAFLTGYYDELKAAGIDSFWIGANDNNTNGGKFMWSNGGSITYQHWLHNPPPNTNGHLDCAFISTSDRHAYWRTTGSCFTKKAFVCTVPVDKPIKTITTPRPRYTCDKHWGRHGNMCYQFNDTRMSWLAARTACQGQGADLVKITSDDVEGFVNAGTHRQEYWIGLNDRKRERTYVWLDETKPDPSKYFRWNNHEPNNLQGENCVETRGLGWNDKDCSTHLKFVCQKLARNYQLPSGSTLPAQPHYSTKCGLLWEEDPSSDYCYMFNIKALDWEDARDSCRNHGGDLASIQSREEGSYLNTRIQNVAMFAFWIGANDRSSEGGWKWSDGSPFVYLNWAPGEPNDFKHNEDCVGLVARQSYLAQHSFKWTDFPCTNRFGYICKKLGLTSTTAPPKSSPTPPVGMAYGCRDYWKHNGAFCYLFSHQKLNWNDAKSRCTQYGGYLASIASRNEQNYIYSQLKNFKGISVWIGLNDLLNDMNFQWTDGSRVTYTNWARNEPNNYHNTREDCVNMYIHGGYWNDAICDSTGMINGFVCKQPQRLMSATPKPESVGCTLPAVGYGASCYFSVAGQTKTWQAAETDCKNRFHSHLATVNDRYTQSFLSAYLAYKDDVFWIGLSDTVSPGSYKWISGWPVSFSYWSATHTGNERSTCVAMRNNHPRGLWENHNCTETHHYWCQYPRKGFSTPPTTVFNPNSGSCPTGWSNFGQKCYKAYDPKQITNQKTWMEARDYCQSIGANLASIHSQAEDTFFSGTLLSSYRTSFWIGLNDRANENGYVWIDGSPTDFTNWHKGEPNNFKDTEDCTEYAMLSSSWNDNNCYLSNSFICEIQKGVQLLTTAAPPSAATSSLACGNALNWLYYNGSCYYISIDTNTTKNAYDATQFCNINGGTLASIHSLDENNLIFSQITKRSGTAYWIGLNDLSTTTYTWTDNTMLDFAFWLPGEPNDAFGGERCVVMTSTGGLWNDDNCNEDFGFICRKSTTSVKQITPAPTALINAGCDKGFIPMPNSNKCFLIKSDTKANWTDARDMCRSNGPGYDIASINSAAEQSFLITQMKGIQAYGLWIGLNNLRHHGHFVWQDNSPFTYQNWARNEPNGNSDKGPTDKNPTTEDCVQIYPASNRWIQRENIGKWNDIRCSNLFGYICQGQRVNGILAPNPGTQCKSGYSPYGIGCYKILSSRASWQNAATSCSSSGGVLASVLDVYEESFINSILRFKNQTLWIGMKYSNQRSYTWLDGWPVLYTHWGSGQPYKSATGGCVAIINGKWRDKNCKLQFSYVCKITPATPPPSTNPPPGTCGPKQAHHGDYCYEGHAFSARTWPVANYMCQKLGMNLVSIHSTDELTFVWQTMILGKGIPKGYTKTPPAVWIGMNKGLSDGFTWSDSSPVNFLNWNSGEPSDPMNSTTEECVQLFRQNGLWNDKNCFTPLGYICKGLAVKPTTPRPKTQAPQNPQTPAQHNSQTPAQQNPQTPAQQNPQTQAPNTTPNPIPNVPNVPNYNGRQSQAQAASSSGSLSTGGIAAILVSVVFILVLVGLGTIFWKRRSTANGGGGFGTGGIDNSLYYEKSNEEVNFAPSTSNGKSTISDNSDA